MKRYVPSPALFAFFLSLVFQALVALSSCSTRGAAQAEEYFSIGMAYYEMGKFAEAENWLNRARAADRTMTASAYNLGRISFETGRYAEAAKHFESILSRDENNVIALKAAAYARIKNGDLSRAEALYNRVLAIVPESADDGFNYALVLYSMEKYENCESVLNKYPYALEENSASMLLFARAQKAQNKVEAADSYAKWALTSAETPNAQGLYEYAQVLESAELYARAVEQYKAAAAALPQDTETLKKSSLRFEAARLLLVADPENPEGITELSGAVTDGFSDEAALETLLEDERISETNLTEITTILDNLRNKETAPVPEEGTDIPAGETPADEAAAPLDAPAETGTEAPAPPLP